MHADSPHTESPSPSDLQVHVHEDDWPQAAEAVAGLPSASFFQRPAWLRAVQQADSRLTPFGLTVTDAAGTVQGAWSFAAVRRWGVVRLYAGPWGTYGGVLARHAAAAAALQSTLRRVASTRRVVLVRVHDFAGAASLVAGDPFWRRQTETCQVLDLPEDPTVLFRDAFTSQNRNKIRKAERTGLRVRRAGDAAALRTYAHLYRQAASRWQLRRPLPERFFVSLAGIEGVDVWLAEAAGEPVAALLNLRGGGQIMNWGNVSLRRAWPQAPNNLLHWKAIEAACTDAHAPRLYNFGSSAGLPGVQVFKDSFGTRQHGYSRDEHRAPLVDWWRRRVGKRP